MFSISDIKQEAYPAAYRRGKELYERGLVQEFSYDVYTEDGVPKAELIGRVKGTVEDHYDVRLVIDEEYAEVSESRCNCEAFCNYEGICKHCVAVALAYVNRRQAKDILNAKLGVSEKTEFRIHCKWKMSCTYSLLLKKQCLSTIKKINLIA